MCFLYRYMKYLYDYECEKKNLSTRSELDAAIEGNKREGRRASGQYDAQAALAMVSKVMIWTLVVIIWLASDLKYLRPDDINQMELNNHYQYNKE